MNIPEHHIHDGPYRDATVRPLCVEVSCRDFASHHCATCGKSYCCDHWPKIGCCEGEGRSLASILSLVVAIVGLGCVWAAFSDNWPLLVIYPFMLVISLVLGGVGLTSRSPGLATLGILLTLSPLLLLLS